MKKILILASLFIAIASYGGSAILANAQSLTPTQTAALQQQLDNAKAQLVKLQMDAGRVPAGDSSFPGNTAAPTVTVTPSQPSATSMTLSAADIASINTALNGLTTALLTIQSEVSANPQLVASNSAGVISALRGIGTTLGTITNEIQSRNIAMATPSTGSTGSAMTGTGVAQANPGTAGSSNSAGPSVAIKPSTQQPTPAPATAPAAQNTAPIAATTQPAAQQPQTAQATSAFSWSNLNWPLIVVIILIIAAIAIWLWWDDSEEKPAVRTIVTSNNLQRPLSPAQPLQMNTHSSGPTAAHNSPASAPTPLSSAMGPQQKKTA